MKSTYIPYFIFLLLFSVFANAQKIERINLKKANKLKGGTFNGQKINKLLGDVVLTHNDATMYCDSAYQYLESNKVDAFGHVIIKDKGTTVTGDVLYYNGDTELAQIRGNQVTLVDKKQTLTTQFLDYNLKTSTGVYFNGGKLVDEKSVLTSERGTYYNQQKKYTFKKNVILVRDNYVLKSDTLEYHSATKKAYFHGPTHINSANQHLFAKKGDYHTIKEISNFKDSAYIETKDYILMGDSLHFDNAKDIGKAFRNVKLHAYKDSLTIYGDKATRWGKLGYAEIYGNAIALKELDKDTLYLLADTLTSQEDTLGKKRAIQGFHHVKIYNKDFQGKCDSLIYLTSDSMITLFREPVLWNEKTQITADTIIATMANGSIHKAYTYTKSFIVSHDTLTNYNQIKGKNMIAHFKNSTIDYIDVNGNGESLYYAKDNEEKNKIIGLNYIICSNMVIYFKNDALNQISFLKKPDARFIPPHEISPKEKTLKDFSWKIKIRPQLFEFNERVSLHKENIN